MSNKKNILFYNSSSVSLSQEGNVVFLEFSNSLEDKETIAISADNAYRIAKKILESLKKESDEETEQEEEMDRASLESPKSKRVVLDPNLPLKQLQQIFNTSTPEVRLQVIRVLAKRKDEQGLILITKGTSDKDPRVRRLATEALGYFPFQDCVSVLMEQLKDSDKVVRLKAIESLAKIGDNSVAPALKQVIDDPSVTIRRNVSELLSNISDEKMIMTFNQLLKDDDPEVRLTATKALSKIGGPVAASSLSIAIKDQDRRIREHAVRALGKTGNPSLAPILLNVLNADQSLEVRQRAAESIAKLGDSSGLKQMLRILKNENEPDEVRAAVANAVGVLGGMTEVPVLISLLKSVSVILRMNAAIALGKINDTSALPTLKYLVENDQDAHVRGAAILALWEIKDSSTIKVICKALRDKSNSVKACAAEVLGKWKSHEALESLQIAMEDGDDYVRSRVSQAIREIQGI
ncbi:MAG: HEAT repeat domain-containing protein [Candidatus Brocadiae bacterium]|nr:HEAT repeat domain-containing protein [Candidatus Brocadiia bacterium]